jgi:hypothetical protein
MGAEPAADTNGPQKAEAKGPGSEVEEAVGSMLKKVESMRAEGRSSYDMWFWESN